MKQKETDEQLKELEVKLNQREQLKEDSLLSKISAFFNPSLDEITLDDLMKKEEPSESKSYPKYNTESI